MSDHSERVWNDIQDEAMEKANREAKERMPKPTTDEQLARIREEVSDYSAVSVLPGLLARLAQAEQRVRELEKQRDEARLLAKKEFNYRKAHVEKLEQRVQWLLDQRDELESQVEVLLKRVRELEKQAQNSGRDLYEAHEVLMPELRKKLAQARRDALREALDEARRRADAAARIRHGTPTDGWLHDFANWLECRMAEENE